jgi:hypothetical protein
VIAWTEAAVLAGRLLPSREDGRAVQADPPAQLWVGQSRRRDGHRIFGWAQTSLADW